MSDAQWKVSNDNGLWIVQSQSGPWYTLTGTGPDAHICNATGRPIKAGGQDGRRLRRLLISYLNEVARTEATR